MEINLNYVQSDAMDATPHTAAVEAVNSVAVTSRMNARFHTALELNSIPARSFVIMFAHIHGITGACKV